MNVTEKQKKILLDYMRKNEDFTRGRLCYNSSNKKILDDMWANISTSLNSVGLGPQKQSKEWQKTWRDWKANVLKKCAENKSYAGGTGGGPPKVIKLTELEENLLEIINPEAVGLTNIPEGGNFNRINQKESMSIINRIAKRGSFHTQDAELHKMQESEELKEYSSNFMQKKRKCTSTLVPSKIYKVDDTQKKTSTSINRIYSTDLSAQGHLADDACVYLQMYPLTYAKVIGEISFKTSMLSSNTIYNVDDTETNTSPSPSTVYDTDFSPQEIENNNFFYHNFESNIEDTNVPEKEDEIIEPREYVIPKEASGKGREALNKSHEAPKKVMYNKKENSTAAVELMRKTLEIKEEKLTILREKLLLKKEKFDYLKSFYSDCKIVLNNVDFNIMRLREEVEKMAPSYLA